LTDVLRDIQPTEIYNLAAASFVGKSWDEWKRYQQVNGEAPVRIFEAALSACPDAHVYQASSSEMFGNTSPPHSEDSPFAPRSPYGASKAYAHDMARIFRESYGLHVSCGICFNHESPRRGEEFVSRKIAQQVAWVSKHGGTIPLGDLKPKRDWGHATDYVKAMWLMLQAPEPDDYVVATGESRSVQEFLQLACAYAGLNWGDVYEKDEQFTRPAEVYDLRGDSSKIRDVLGWEPAVSFDDMVREMVMHEMEQLRDDESQREAPTDLQPELQGTSGGQALRRGLSGEAGSPEDDSKGAWSHPPHVEPMG
jgi:GDPmannose 4,6-dehydratase